VQRVSWRKVAAICVSVLLPLPLVLLLWALLKPDVPAGPGRGMHVSPMLDNEQRMRLLTYRHECRSGAECEPPLACLFEARYNQAYCTDSQCMLDAQCPENHACRPLATKDSGLLVRICVPIGERHEGEYCDPAPRDKGHACAAGLVCSGHDYHWCGRPCRPGAQATGCPEGFFCAETAPEPICLPTCTERECPEGQHCVRFEEGASVCARVYGPNCRESPCADGQVCRALTAPTHPGKIWMECIERCGKDASPCGPGKVCDGWQCLPSCSPQSPGVCEEGFRCRQPWPDSPFACHPDW